MKKLLFTLLLLIAGCGTTGQVYATSISMPYCSATTGSPIYAAQWNGNCNTVSTFLNNNNLDGTTNISIGGILTQNLANLSVTDAKIAGITTAGKVNGSALTGLNNTPSGANTLPEINVHKLDSSGNGVDGSALSGLGNTTAGAGVLPAANTTATASNTTGIVGTSSSATIGSSTPVTTDGMLTAIVDCHTSGIATISVSSTGGNIAFASCYFGYINYGSATIIVKKGQSYTVTYTLQSGSPADSASWTPIGS